ncbi:MAG TPA: thioredoxin [Planctomycetota bacterium]|nr:thioredoxin [Planctomycetota bacterium]
MAKNVVQVTDDDFDAVVLAADKPVLVDFWAEWCPPCRMIAPVVEQIAAEYEGKLIVAKLDTENNTKAALRFNVTAIPTLILFRDGEIAERSTGFRDKATLKKLIDGVIG